MVPLTKIRNIGGYTFVGKMLSSFLDLLSLRCLGMMSEGNWIDGFRVQPRDWTRDQDWEVIRVALKIKNIDKVKEFPGSPVVRTPHFHYKGHGLGN